MGVGSARWCAGGSNTAFVRAGWAAGNARLRPAAPRFRASATGIDEGVHEFLARSLDRTWFPYVPPTWTWENTETVDFRIVLITRALGSVRPRARQCDGLHDLRQTTPEAVAAQCERVIDSLKDAFPKAAQMLVNAQPDLTAFAAFRGTGPRSGRSNPIERLGPRNPAPRRRRPGSSPTATASPA